MFPFLGDAVSRGFYLFYCFVWILPHWALRCSFYKHILISRKLLINMFMLNILRWSNHWIYLFIDKMNTLLQPLTLELPELPFFPHFLQIFHCDESQDFLWFITPLFQMYCYVNKKCDNICINQIQKPRLFATQH